MTTPPLSAFQQRLWILHELEPDGHRLVAGFRVHGPLDTTAVADAWNACVARHAVLRSVFPAREGAPRVGSLPVGALAANVASAPPTSGQEREAFLRSWLDEACARPFDLASGPLARLALLRLADDDHILLLTAHQSVCDERSLRLLLDELGGGAAPPRHDFAEAARAQQAWLASPAAAAELGFWRQRLAGIPEALELPCDHPRPRVQAYRRGSMAVLLPPGAESPVPIRDGAPQAPLAVAAFAALLHRHSREEDLVIGWSPLAADATAPLGPCDEPSVLRLAIDSTTTARGLIAGLHAEAEQALRHRALPFARLVDALAPRRDLGRTPLFQAMVAESPPPRLLLGEHAELLVQELVPSRCDLVLVIEDPVAGRARLDYNAALFDEATIARLAGHLRILAAAAAAEPDRPLAALPLLAAEERRQVVTDWNRTAAGFPDQGVHQLVARQAALSPDAVAVAHGRTTLSYRELDQRADRLAARLRRLGIGRDRVVGLCAERSCEAMVAVLAVLKAGGAYLPLDPAYPGERLAFMLVDAKATVLLAQRHLAARLPAGDATVVPLDEPQPGVEAEDPPADQAPAPEQLAYVIYTSGSTGMPKGIAMPHGPLANLIAWQLGRSQAGPGARTLQFSSLSFDVSFQELFSTWCAGGTLVLVDEAVRRDPLALLRLLAAERVERLFLPFVALQQLAEAGAVEAAPLRLREVVTAGEQLRITPAIAAWFARLPGCTLHNHYGPSESHVVTAHELAGAPATWPELPPIGRPIANARIYLLDGLREPVPVGVAGELWIAGPVLARGYLGRPELTAERFVADPFVPGGTMYRSGDLARWRADGSIDFLGRVDQQVKLRGFRIELGEVEAALARHPAVRAAAAVVREVEPGDRRLLAYVVAEPAGADLPLELRRLLQQRLPDYLVPSAIALIGRLPLTPSGKLDRRALPAIAQPGAAAAHVMPRNDLEQAIARAWREVLRTERVGSDDNFFDLGGHSLHLVQVVLRLRESLGQELPIAILFQYPTIGALARHLGELRARAPSDRSVEKSILVPLQTKGRRRPFFFISGFLDIGRHVGDDQPFYGLDLPAEIMRGAEQLRFFEVAQKALAAIRIIQPKGPYLLGGHCFGAVVAFAVVNHLEAAGEEVELLALMDPPNPPQCEARQRLSDRLHYHMRNLLHRGPIAQIRYLGERLRNISKRLRTSVDDDDAELYQDFSPSVYSGRILMLLAQDTFHSMHPEQDPRLMWRHWAREGIESVGLPGDHVTFCREPLVRHTGLALRAFIDRAMSRAAGMKID